jgi:Protein of unknown function (DUF1360)
VTTPVQQAASRTRARYESGERRPLQGYLLAMGAYAAGAGALVGLGRGMGARLPERVGPGDTALVCVATHKGSRMLAKDTVTSPLRAPFTRFEEPAGESELNESVRGRGAQHALGELVTCPFCLSVWVASGLVAGLVFAPRITRLVATTLTAVAVSDTLQLGYDAAKQLLQRVGD